VVPSRWRTYRTAGRDRQRGFLSAGIRGAACIAVLLPFPLIVLPSWILTAWLGAGFEASVTPLALLGAAVVFSASNAILAQYRKVVTEANDKFSIVSAYEGLEIPLGDDQ